MKFSKFVLATFILSRLALGSEGPIPVSAWPQVASEDCSYSGTSEYNGKLKARTIYSRNDQRIKIQTLVQFTASLFGISKDYLFDEIVSIDPNSGEITKVEKNTRQIDQGWMSSQFFQAWDSVSFDWNNKYNTTKLNTLRIVGQDQQSFSHHFPAFAKFWPTAMFGKNWINEFYNASPEKRKDLDLSGFDQRLIPPLLLSFYVPRIAVPARDKDFVIFVHAAKDGKPESAIAAPIRVSYEQAGTNTKVRSRIIFGDLQSPPNEPSTLIVQDQKIKTVNFILAHPSLGKSYVHGNFSLNYCR